MINEERLGDFIGFKERKEIDKDYGMIVHDISEVSDGKAYINFFRKFLESEGYEISLIVPVSNWGYALVYRPTGSFLEEVA